MAGGEGKPIAKREMSSAITPGQGGPQSVLKGQGPQGWQRHSPGDSGDTTLHLQLLSGHAQGNPLGPLALPLNQAGSQT